MDINYKDLFENSIVENVKLKDDMKKINDENNKLHEEINELKERLKKYTAPTRSKSYYEKHKDKYKQFYEDNKMMLIEKSSNFYYKNLEARRNYNHKYYYKMHTYYG